MKWVLLSLLLACGVSNEAEVRVGGGGRNHRWQSFEPLHCQGFSNANYGRQGGKWLVFRHIA